MQCVSVLHEAGCPTPCRASKVRPAMRHMLCSHPYCHVALKAEAIAAAGHVPDKVLLLECVHAVLLDRIKYRRIDTVTGMRT
jgi:hypothetical protein